MDAEIESPTKIDPDQLATGGTSLPAAAPDEGARSFWGLVREALVGSRRDLTTMPLGRAIFLLAIPMVLEMAMESIFTLADIFWLAHVSPEAVATAGLTETLMTLIYTAAMGLAIGVGAVVSRRTGAQDRDGAGRAAVQAVVLGLAASVVVGVAGALAGPALLGFMGASPEVLSTGAGFSRVMLGGSGTVVMLFLINSAFRGAGDAALTLRTLALSNTINIVLGPVLIFGLGPAPRLGVTGAAVATTIGRGIGVLYQLRNLKNGAGRLHVPRSEVRIDRETLRSILTIARSAVWQVFIGTSSWIFLTRIIASFGSQVLAGYTLAMRVLMFTLLPSFGLGNAAATLVGQSLGAGNPARGEQAVWRAAFYNLIFLGGVGLALFLGPELVLRFFTTNPVVVEQGARCLRILAVGYPLYAYAMVVSQAFNGAGNSKTPTRINLVCFWLFEIPIAFLLTRVLGVGPWGVYVAIPLAFSAMAISSVVLFRRGTWKTVKI